MQESLQRVKRSSSVTLLLRSRSVKLAVFPPVARRVVRSRPTCLVHGLVCSLSPSALLHLVQHLDTGEGGKEVQRLSRGLNMLRGRVKHGYGMPSAIRDDQGRSLRAHDE